MDESAGQGLVERTDELAAMSRAVDAVTTGREALVVVQGPAGIGKSALLAAARSAADAKGARVLAAAGSELVQTAPFAVVSALLGPVLAAAGTRDELLTGQAGLAAPLFDGSLPLPGESDGLLRGLYWLVAGLAGTTNGLLLSVDDAQWADRASLRFLLHLASGLDGVPVALVLAVRTGEPGAPSDLLDRLAALPSAAVVQPRPLSEDGARRVVADVLGATDEAFARACAVVSGGNPFLLRELSLALREAGVAPTGDSVPAVEAAVPGSVTRAVLVRLSRVPVEARRLATAVAVLGEGAAVPTAAALAGLSIPEAEVAADGLAEAAVLAAGAPLRFVHPLLGAVVHDDLPAFAAARAHRRAADLLLAAGATAETVAAHLLRADPAGDGRTVGLVRAAAASALARGEPGTAVLLLRRGLAEPPVEGDLFDVVLELAIAEGRAAERSAGTTVTRALGLATGPDQRIRALTAQASIHYSVGDIAGLLAAAEQALDLLDEGDPRAQQLLARCLAAGGLHAPSRPRTERHLDRLIARTRAGLPPAHPALLAQVALHEAFDGRPAEEVRTLAEHAVAADPLIDPSAHGLPLSLAVQALVTVDELVAAERLADAGMAAARDRGDEVAFALTGFHRALPRYHRGDLRGALADLDASVRLRDQGWSGGSGFLAHLLVRLHVAGDDLAAARCAVAPRPRDGVGYLDQSMAGYAHAELALAEERFDAAEEAAMRVGRELSDGFRMDHPGLAAWRCVVARASHSRGEHDRARRFAEDALERARWSGVARPLAEALRTAAAVGSGRPALESLHEAAEVLADSAAGLEHTAVLVDLGAASRREGHPDDARRTLLEAFVAAEGMRAHRLARRARKELYALGLRPRRAAATGRDALTPSELRVAELVGAGLSNREVAEALFVTTKTVESHLAGVFRKMGVTSRHDLAGRLSVTAEATPDS
jgi:DNA-binding CsgD family transcriptional regulator